MHVFAEDWLFTTRELLTGEAWFPTIGPEGSVVARGIPDGPDHDFDKLRWAILGALARARHRVRIVTPYFLPDTTLVTSLNLAALRGVAVDVVLPDKNNLPYVKWACQAQLWQILSRDCRVFYSPPPFDHTKLLVVDGAWALIGSANWDPRSLRLNFEFNVELYDAVLGGRLDAIVDEKIAAAREITLADVDGRPFSVKLRDGVARLFSPYL
jgi:cardiolipin synthase